MLTHFYYGAQWQVLEERVGTSTSADKQYVYHPHCIDAVAMMRDSSGDEFYYLQDSNHNVTALIDDTGAVVERYQYTPYGEVDILDSDFSDDADGLSDVTFVQFSVGTRSRWRRLRPGWPPCLRFLPPPGFRFGLACGCSLLGASEEFRGVSFWTWAVSDST